MLRCVGVKLGYQQLAVARALLQMMCEQQYRTAVSSVFNFDTRAGLYHVDVGLLYPARFKFRFVFLFCELRWLRESTIITGANLKLENAFYYK